MIVSFISLPLTLNYMGDERFGMMTTIVAAVSLMNFADLGLGYGLQNRIPEYASRKEEAQLERAVSSTFFFLCIVSVMILLGFLAVYPFVAWNKLFNVSSATAITESAPSVLVLVLCFSISIPISIVQKIQGGFQEGYFNNFWQSAGSVAGLGLLYLAIVKEAGVPVIIACIYGTNALFLFLNFTNQIAWRRRHLFPKFKLVDWSILKVILLDGAKFTLIQVMAIGMATSDNLIISQVMRPEAVAPFAVGLKIVSLITIPTLALMSPSLPAINDAIAQNDGVWVNKLFKRGFRLVCACSIGLFLLFYFGVNYLITVWLGAEHQLSAETVFGFSVFVVYFNLNYFFSYFMMSKRLLKSLAVIFPIAVLLTVAGKIFFVGYAGLSGLLIATSLIMVLTYFVPSYFVIKQQIK